MNIALLDNDITKGNYEIANEIPIEILDSETAEYINEWRTYQYQNANLENHIGQAYSLLLGQCTQLLQYKINQEMDFKTTSNSYDPLALLQLIEKTVLTQTEDQYPIETVYNQEVTSYTFHQGTINNTQWYERLNTKFDVSNSIGVTRQHKSLLEYVTQDVHSLDFDLCMEKQEEAMHIGSEQRYLSYALLIQRRNHPIKLKVDIQNYFTTVNNLYTKSRPQTLHILDKYSKIAVPKIPASEGSSFAQVDDNKGDGRRVRGNKRGGDGKKYDKNY